MPNTDLKKTLTDAGYIAIGLGVMGFQQAQTRARDAASAFLQVHPLSNDAPAA